jgi:hypothetical protein
MASSIINSDDGLVSGVQGLKSTGGDDGALVFQSNGTETARITTSGTLQLTDDLTFTGTGNRITGDFSNATVANRVLFQTSTTNGVTRLGLLPNGTATTTSQGFFNATDPANAGFLALAASSTEAQVVSSINGTGTFLPMTFSTGGSERMRIDTSGNVGIGTSSPAFDAGSGLEIERAGVTTLRLDNTTNSTILELKAANGAVAVSGRGNYALLFETNGLERARIDSSGNLLVGTTNTSATAGAGFKLTGSATLASTVASFSTNANSNWLMYSTGASAYRFFVQWDGKVNATNDTIAAISDQRLKENIEDIDVGLDKVMALKPRKFDWKEGKGKNIKGDRGWIAQEFEQVFPEMIGTWPDKAPEGEEPYKSVCASLIPVLVKAIQELKAELDTVKTELATLKGQA